MSTYGAMIDRIERELLRTDLTTEIQDAIKTAIQHYSDERFWFNENDEDPNFSTVASRETYTMSSEYLEVDQLTVEVSSNEYPLIKRTFDWMREVNTNPDTVVGIPTDYAFHGDKFWLYPTPNGVFPVRLYGLRRLHAVDANEGITITATACTNAWFTHGEDLIRNRALSLVYTHKLRNPQLASVYGGEDSFGVVQGREGQALRKLRRRTRKKIGMGFIQPTVW